MAIDAPGAWKAVILRSMALAGLTVAASLCGLLAGHDGSIQSERTRTDGDQRLTAHITVS